ncbi:iron complex transport system ATP-binding protein [Parvibaculum indicum]|uniref:ABC transporter ATP-binding protein n=1 Tax=Parvibaculum indicum TaxID=562969 RepID=UPI0014210AC1|nr:ABC transporter ATP-binding protein [Parvibaculum indicum]NIJ42961.1 iron complex transport system ATP-binding protein [Parvibaculum indicum]
MTELVLRHLHASLGGARIIHDVSLDIPGPGFIGLVGPNGAGKTTLIRAIASLIPFEGDILLDGIPLSHSISPNHVRNLARRLAYLAQNAESHWPIEVSRLVALGRLPHLEPFRKMREADEKAVERAMELADVARYRGRDVMSLSGGERARVLLARALAVEAPLLLVDEPVASLDPYHQLRIMEVLENYAKNAGRIVVAVLHDLSLAARFCDRLVLLHEGKIRAAGPPDTVLTDENLEDVYRVKVFSGREGETRYIVPLSRTE